MYSFWYLKNKKLNKVSRTLFKLFFSFYKVMVMIYFLNAVNSEANSKIPCA